MNPFDLPGPAFLLFYVVLATVVIGGVVLLRRRFESGAVPRLGEADPYFIAYLRGGANEAIRVAILSLLDRGLLMAAGDKLEAEVDAEKRVRRPLERSILNAFVTARTASRVFSDHAPRAACEALAGELRKHGLLPTTSQIGGRILIGVGAVAILWWTAWTKIEIALMRGRHNILFLVVLGLAVPFVVGYLLRSRTTVLGQRMIQDFQTLFSRLRDRASEIHPGGATNELALLAGVFGVGALSGWALAQSQALFPKSIHQAAGSTSTSCGSACGSSCGSSCGGGGCGGGCGGCGG